METPLSPLAVPQYRFAQQVTVKAQIYRCYSVRQSDGLLLCTWVKSTLSKPILGIVIRKIALTNGVRHPEEKVLEDWETQTYEYIAPWYEPTEKVTAYEVAYSLSRKTILVHWQDLEACE